MVHWNSAWCMTWCMEWCLVHAMVQWCTMVHWCIDDGAWQRMMRKAWLLGALHDDALLPIMVRCRMMVHDMHCCMMVHCNCMIVHCYVHCCIDDGAWRCIHGSAWRSMMKWCIEMVHGAWHDAWKWMALHWWCMMVHDSVVGAQSNGAWWCIAIWWCIGAW